MENFKKILNKDFYKTLHNISKLIAHVFEIFLTYIYNSHYKPQAALFISYFNIDAFTVAKLVYLLNSKSKIGFKTN